jgi:hypothetical protein
MLRRPDRVIALERDGTIRLYAPRGGAPEGDSIVISSLWDSSVSVVRARYQFDTSIIPH